MTKILSKNSYVSDKSTQIAVHEYWAHIICLQYKQLAHKSWTYTAPSIIKFCIKDFPYKPFLKKVPVIKTILSIAAKNTLKHQISSKPCLWV